MAPLLVFLGNIEPKTGLCIKYCIKASHLRHCPFINIIWQSYKLLNKFICSLLRYVACRAIIQTDEKQKSGKTRSEMGS